MTNFKTSSGREAPLSLRRVTCIRCHRSHSLDMERGCSFTLEMFCGFPLCPGPWRRRSKWSSDKPVDVERERYDLDLTLGGVWPEWHRQPESSALHLDGFEDALVRINDNRSNSHARLAAGGKAKGGIGLGGGMLDNPEQHAINPPPLTSEMCPLWGPTGDSHRSSGHFSDRDSTSRILTK